MASFSSEKATIRPPAKGPTNPSGNNLSSLPDFHFKTIGKEPALLQRISAPDATARTEDDMSAFRTSVSSPDPNEFKPSNVPARVSGIKQPSLQERLSMFNSPGNIHAETPSLTEARHLSRLSVAASGPPHRSTPVNEACTLISQPASMNENHRVTSRIPLSPNHEATLPSPVSPSPSQSPESIHNPVPPPSVSSASSNLAMNRNIQHRPSAIPPPAPASGPSFDLLRDLQERISSALANFGAISTAPAVRLAKAARDQCAEVVSSARHAIELAEHALVAAQQSATSARHCLSIAESLQAQTDECLAALDTMKSEEAPILNNIQDVAVQLHQWINDREAYEARRRQELEEREASLQRTKVTPSRPGGSSRLPFASETDGAMAMEVDERDSLPLLHTVEHEAQAAALAWREQNAERQAAERRAYEEAQRKLREAEELQEQKNREIKALAEASEAELARIRAELVAAEERRRRQEQEAELRARTEEEARQRAIAQRRVSLERAAQSAKEKQRADQKERDNALHGRNPQEPNQVLSRPSNPQSLELQRRLAAERASAEVAKKSQEERVNVKSPTQSSLPLTPKAALSTPSLPASPSVRLNTAPHDFGNVVSKKTLLTANFSSDKKASVPISGNVPVSRLQGISTPASSQPGPVSANSTSLQSSVTSSALTDPRRQVPSSLPPKPTSVPLPTRLATHNSPADARTTRAINGVQATPPASSSQLRNETVSTSQPANLPDINDEPIPGLSNYPKRPSQASIVPVAAPVDTRSSDLGHAILVPPQHLPPVSADVQRANLRGLMDANGAGTHQAVKHEVEEEKPARSESGMAASAQMHNNKPRTASNVGPHLKMPKKEPQDDAPLMYSPVSSPMSSPTATTVPPPLPAHRALPSGQQLPEARRQESAHSSGPPPGLRVAGEYQADGQASSSMARPLPADVSAVGPSPQVRTSGQTTAPTSLPARPLSALTPSIYPSRSAPEIYNRAPVANTFDDSSRMGPDASIASGWSQTNLTQEDLPPSRPLSRSGSSRGVDHYSPPPRAYNRNNRGVRLRNPRRSTPVRDHYSPEHSRFSPPPSRSRSASGNNSRGVSPNQRYRPPYNARPRSPNRVPSRAASPVAGQKRGRDEQDVAGRSNRRARYDRPPRPPLASAHNNEPPPYASTSYGNGYQEEWSHSAEYGRSPSPDGMSRSAAPLAERIAGEPGSRGLVRQRLHDLPDRRSPNSRLPARGAGPSPTRHYRGPRNDSRPQLLDRFTDATAERPHQRRGPPPLEDRIAGKDSLINRLM